MCEQFVIISGVKERHRLEDINADKSPDKFSKRSDIDKTGVGKTGCEGDYFC